MCGISPDASRKWHGHEIVLGPSCLHYFEKHPGDFHAPACLRQMQRTRLFGYRPGRSTPSGRIWALGVGGCGQWESVTLVRAPFRSRRRRGCADAGRFQVGLSYGVETNYGHVEIARGYFSSTWAGGRHCFWASRVVLHLRWALRGEFAQCPLEHGADTSTQTVALRNNGYCTRRICERILMLAIRERPWTRPDTA
ncbi:hypothetical protein BC826DRAFT_1027970 [Russula brevipes]|nr:hypothetical protein BC826DRAFT_1027970 [Russula brevipes]